MAVTTVHRQLPELDAPSPRVEVLHSSSTSEIYTAPLAPRGPLALVKRSKITCARDLERFEREVSLLSSLSHECVIVPMGAVRAPPTYALVLPLFHQGSLFRLLHNSNVRLTPRGQLSLILDAFSAVVHLHAAGVLHRDIKPDNLLIADDGRAVLTDFNAAELAENVTGEIMVQARPTGGFFKQFVVGTLPYMAPELLQRGGSSGAGSDFFSCDVYSLAITANEILTGAIPYSEALTEHVKLHTILEARYNHDDLVAGITTCALRPALPTHEGAGAELIELVKECWSDDLEARPSAHAAETRIRALFSLDRFAGAGSPREAIATAVSGPSQVACGAGAARTPGTDAKAAITKSAVHGSAITSRPSGASGPNITASRDVNGDSTIATLARACGATAGPSHRVAAEATAGKRGLDRMEDRHAMAQAGGLTVVAVFDGHGGDGAPSFCAGEIIPQLEREYAAASADFVGNGDIQGGQNDNVADPVTSRMSTALRSSFVVLNERFLAAYPNDDSGCTALVAVVLPHIVLVANAGDCRAYLWRHDAPLLPLSREHVAAEEAERQQVVARGGFVKPTSDGKMRVGGVIQVTRSIGDRDLRALGLSAEPEVICVPRGKGDIGVVLASDGLWDVMSEERTLHCLNNTARSPDMLAKRLVFDAMDKGTQDNVTCAVVLF